MRFRIDGVLHVAQRIPTRSSLSGVATRLKVLAKLDIAERRKPQDGRISLDAAAAGRLLDIRVATLPTVEGESVTMRLLDKSRTAPTLEELGLSDAMRDELRDIVAKPTGALLVTGPTGSGKSTTLYAVLAEISRPEINVITVEDPVEYRLAGISQVQINPRAGLTFATALRSILRSDPDVVMVGEIRDGETAQDLDRGRAHRPLRALDAAHERRAGRGHAPERDGRRAVPHGAAVSAVLAQRLARKLCPHCVESVRAGRGRSARGCASAGARSEALHAEHASAARSAAPRCSNTGYRGRVGIFQLLRMNEELESSSPRKATPRRDRGGGDRDGMRSLWDDGLDKVARGRHLRRRARPRRSSSARGVVTLVPRGPSGSDRPTRRRNPLKPRVARRRHFRVNRHTPKLALNSP